MLSGDALDIRMMGVALSEAENALAKGFLPVGAVLASGDVLIARASKSEDSNYLSHAEMNVFHAAFGGRPDLGGSLTLYTTLEPCVMCFGTLWHLPIRRLVYAMEDAYGGFAHTAFNNLPPRHQSRELEIVGGVRRKEARRLLRHFFEATSEPYWIKGGAPHLQAAVMNDDSGDGP
jgi:tRNA(adenine34) deaminase